VTSLKEALTGASFFVSEGWHWSGQMVEEYHGVAPDKGNPAYSTPPPGNWDEWQAALASASRRSDYRTDD